MEEEPSTGTPLWGAGSSADAVGQQTNEEAPGAAMRRVKKRVALSCRSCETQEKRRQAKEQK